MYNHTYSHYNTLHITLYWPIFHTTIYTTAPCARNTHHDVGIALCEHADGRLDLLFGPRRLEVLTGVAVALANALDSKPETGSR